MAEINPWVGPWQDTLSGTAEGRQQLYNQYMAGPQFNMFSPFARNILGSRDIPMQGRYMLAAAPEQLGGYGGALPAAGFGEAEFPSYAQFVRNPLNYEVSDTAIPTGGDIYSPTYGGTYSQPDAAALTQQAAGVFSPWTSGQWGSRLGRIGALAPADVWGQTVSGPAYEYLSTITPGEAGNIMQGAMMAGRNPIMRRAVQPGVSRAINQWQEANPEVAAGEMLRQFASQYSGNPGGYVPRVEGGQFTSWAAPQQANTNLQSDVPSDLDSLIGGQDPSFL